VAAAERQSQQAAIARFWTGGEIRRLLRPQAPALHSPLLRCDAPDTLLVAGSAASLDVLTDKLGALGHGARVSRAADRVTISALLPTAWFQILSLVTDTDLVIQAVTGGGAVVSGVGDRLASWELCLASEAAAKKNVCPTCREDRLIPVSVEQGGIRSVCTFCLTCKRAVEPVVDTIAYDSLDFMPRHAEIPRVPRDSGETLRDPVASDDYDYLVSQLLNGLAPGPDAIPYELWKGAPDALKCILLNCSNAILRGDSPPPPCWLGGLVRSSTRKATP